MRNSPEKGKTQQNRRKQIQATLNQLHRLQSQIYDLNIPNNPHSNPPVKKEIKQLTYLYENMTKPKAKNQLNISRQDIQSTLNLLQGNPQDKINAIDSKKLGTVMKKMFDLQLDAGLIKKGENKPSKISVEQLYDFINYNEFDGFDPVKETYNMFMNEDGKFDFKKYVQYSQILGLPQINNEQVFFETLGINGKRELSFEMFEEILGKK